MGLEANADLVAWIQIEDRPDGARVYPGALFTGVDVLLEPVVLLHDARDAHAEAVGEGASNGHLGPAPVELAQGDTCIAIEFVARPCADELQRARGRVPAEQRALRPAEHLHALQVEHGEGVEPVAVQDRFVGVDRRGLAIHEGVVRARDAADRDDLGALLAVTRYDVEVRRDVAELLRPLETVVPQVVAAEHGHRDRHVLRALSAPLGGHQDLFYRRVGVRPAGRIVFRQRQAAGQDDRRQCRTNACEARAPHVIRSALRHGPSPSFPAALR